MDSDSESDNESNQEEFVLDDEIGEISTTRKPIYYDGGSVINIVNRNSFLEYPFQESHSVYFMPSDIDNTKHFVYGKPYYLLRLYGAMENGMKAIVDVMKIKVFFDVRVPDDTNTFLPKITQILKDVNVDFYYENIEAYPIRGYYPTKQKYLRIFTNDLEKRKIGILAIRNHFETASDDLTNYHRKIARERELSLCHWMVLSNAKFSYPEHRDWVRVEVNIEDIKTDWNKNDKDKTLVFTWDIETYSKRKTGEAPDPQ